ncbi:NAD-binding protein [Leptolyngbya sp. FACHB-261]|uniref:NAD-binding protein n=1 Tax=Leptolyngbya sp. FACHB-261 TaxID=2692806 RepID=UPI001684B172|nr:NAD-binding protein [Leptolyngbya sp. FACHB-261]
MSHPGSKSHTSREWVMVCGLGSLGSQCTRALKGYEILVSAVDLTAPATPNALNLDLLVCGDCRQVNVLSQARIKDCRAILLVSDNERVNVEAALAARRLNPEVRLVVRASQQNLSKLLGDYLGNFVAFEPSRLAAPAFALAALNADVLGYFELKSQRQAKDALSSTSKEERGQLLQVIQRTITADDSWLGQKLDQVNTGSYQVLQHLSPQAAKGPGALAQAQTAPPLFHLWQPEQRLQVGDRLVLLTSKNPTDQTHLRSLLQQDKQSPSIQTWPTFAAAYRQLQQGWSKLGRTSRVTLFALTFLLGLILTAIFVFPRNPQNPAWTETLFAALVMVIGGTYADLPPPFSSMALGLRLFSVLLTVTGTVLVGLLYAQLTNWLLTARLRLVRRPPLPRHGHIVLVGLGRLGRQIAALLVEQQQPLVGLEVKMPEDQLLPQLPVVYDSGTTAAGLQQVAIERAHSLLAATSDDLINLEISLLARSLNPGCRLVIRTSDARFSEDVAGLLPFARILCVPVLAAKAFAAASLGENVLALFQLEERTVLVTEYEVTVGDNLHDRLLAEVAYGYSVVPVLHQSPGGSATLCPRYDKGLRLQAGDRLVVLATSSSLQSIEQGTMLPRQWHLTLEQMRPNVDALDVVQVLTRHLDCNLNHAQALLTRLPRVLPQPLYALQAYRLHTALERCGVRTSIRDWKL